MMEWKPIETAPANEVVLTKIDDERGERNVGRLKRIGNLWYTPDGGMYVYYTPTHWGGRAPAPYADDGGSPSDG